MKWIVKITHHRPAYRRGDLEEEDIYFEHSFKTLKEAKVYAESYRKNIYEKIEEVKKEYHRDYKYVCYHIDNYWTNENSGEKQQEYYLLNIKKDAK